MNTLTDPESQVFDSKALGVLAKTAQSFSSLEDICFHASLISSPEHRIGSIAAGAPFKIKGTMLLVVATGHIEIQYNTETISATAPAMITLPHGSLIQLKPLDDNPVELHMVAYSPKFKGEINISFSTIVGESFVEHMQVPILHLSSEELQIVLDYIKMIHRAMADKFNATLSRHIVSSMTTAFFYQTMLFVYRKVHVSNRESVGPRRMNYVQDFLRLVHIYFTKERSVSFYASQLFISPKYLSLLVKEATGRSAARWIDHFVIMEAKNMLRYSGKNVQQVAYALNFPNQSAFGKYFKHLTGLSPTDYQKG